MLYKTIKEMIRHKNYILKYFKKSKNLHMVNIKSSCATLTKKLLRERKKRVRTSCHRNIWNEIR